VLVDLARTGVPFPLFGAGLVGDDALGHEILDTCRKYQDRRTLYRHHGESPDSYTDVMMSRGTAAAPSFMLGSNALWKGAELDFKKLHPRIFHLGYLLLLDSLDEPDPRLGQKPPGCWPTLSRWCQNQCRRRE